MPARSRWRSSRRRPRRDRAALVHRARLPVLERRSRPADGEHSGHSLPVCDEPLRQLEPVGLGRRADPHRIRAGAESRRAAAVQEGPHTMNDISAAELMIEPAILKPAVPAGEAKRPTKIAVRNLDFYYGKVHALKSVNLELADSQVTAIIGPSGCGKSTLLRALTRI